MKNKKIITLSIIAIFGVLVGGCSNLQADKPIDIGHSKKGDFVIVGDMSVPRYFHEAILLDDGRVLLFGGEAENSLIADIYDPETKKFTQLKDKIPVRSGAAITKLIDGQILISGGASSMEGRGGKGFNGTKIYNPTTKKVIQGPNMILPREMHTSTLLKNGRVILIGGEYNNDSEMYDPITNKFSNASKLNIPRFEHSAILLKDGRVLVVGGIGYNKGKFDTLASAEIYNPNTNKFKLIGNMNIPRKNVNLYLLKDGNVLISGGIKKQDKDKGMDSIYVREIELYNPKTNEFKIIAKRTSEANEPAEVLLADDKLLFTGSQTGVGLSLRWYATSEIFDPQTKKFTQGKSMNFRRSCHRATLLKDGNVLISGSYSKNRAAELYIGK